jgi:PmbA protein
MLAHLDRGLLVGRFSGSVDPASGDFSGVAKSGRWVEAGEVVRPVRETLFGGNLFDLMPQILQLSSEPETVMGAALSPWAIVDGVAVTAG